MNSIGDTTGRGVCRVRQLVTCVKVKQTHNTRPVRRCFVLYFIFFFHCTRLACYVHPASSRFLLSPVCNISVIQIPLNAEIFLHLFKRLLGKIKARENYARCVRVKVAQIFHGTKTMTIRMRKIFKTVSQYS